MDKHLFFNTKTQKMKKPSVTNLIKLLDKPALLSWANRIGLQGTKLSEYRKNRMKFGTSVHKEIEQFLKYGICPENEFFHDTLLEFFSEIDVLGIEEKIETEYFQGRYDILLKKGDYTYVCDFKSNHKRNYFENYLQLSAYRMATGADKVAIISVPDMIWFELDIEDFKPYENILISLSNIYITKKLLKH